MPLAGQTLASPGFEEPSLAANAFQYRPTGSGWSLLGSAAIARNGSAFGNPTAPEGSQVLVLQGSSSAERPVCFPWPGLYQLKLKSAQRNGNRQTFKITLDGTPVSYITPAGSSFTETTLTDIYIPSGTHILKLQGTNPFGGDNSAFVDNLMICKNPTVQQIANSGFEAPSLTADTFAYRPEGAGWTFASGGGIARNCSAFDNATAPEGSQVLILQNGGSAQRSVRFSSPGTYRIGLKAAQRLTQSSECEGDGEWRGGGCHHSVQWEFCGLYHRRLYGYCRR
ncbi:MAG: hypothetical protein ABI073_13170 [Luteolibacter sp.]